MHENIIALVNFIIKTQIIWIIPIIKNWLISPSEDEKIEESSGKNYKGDITLKIGFMK